VNDEGLFSVHKDEGLVNDVFTRQVLDGLGGGALAVGHVRYGTTGNNPRLNAQPIVVNHIKGRMALAHNGNLVNASELRAELEMSGSIFHTTSDTEVISYIIVKERLTSGSIEEAVVNSISKLKGAFSLIIMSPSKLIAARDPLGFRPLCIGQMHGGGYVFASESCALDAIGASFLRDVLPGEVVVADDEGLHSITSHCGSKQNLCVFEFIYFARPDSLIEGSSVHSARLRAGAFLALEHPIDADVVIGVPDSGIDAAIGFSRQSGIPYALGFIKNKYIGRTFIQPNQKMRENRVHLKLNPISGTVKGKRVVLVDDSIVRGTTSARIVKLLREAGAAEVHMRVSAPPFTNPCYYGVDIDSRENLIAVNHTMEEIAEIIGVDSIGYLSTRDVVKLADKSKCGFCTACFTGEYPTDVPSSSQKNKFEGKIEKQIGF
jgi:amidophosphoribosyltransferase